MMLFVRNILIVLLVLGTLIFLFIRKDFTKEPHERLGPLPIIKWGFVDKKGQMVIPAKFEDVGQAGFHYFWEKQFSEGLCAVKSQGKWGYIDHSGEWRIRPRFDTARAFREGLAYVSASTRYGYINPEGKMVIRLTTDPIYNGNGAGLLGEFGDRRDFSNGRALVRIGDLYGYIDQSGNIVIQPKYRAATRFSEGLAAVNSTATKRWGYIDITGNEVIAPMYRRADSFHEGLAAVYTAGPLRSRYDGSCSNAVINKSGQLVFDCSGKMCNPGFFSEGLTTAEIYSWRWKYIPYMVGVHSLNNWGVIDQQGKVLFESNSVGTYMDGLASKFDDYSRHTGYVDRHGKWIIKPEFDFPALDFSEGLAAVAKNGKAGYIDKSGRFVIPPIYATSGRVFVHPQSFSEGLAAVPILDPSITK